MPMKMRAGDIWRDATGVWVRVDGTWVRAQNVYARQGDIWRLVFADIFYTSISGSLVDINLRSAAIANGWDQQRPLHFTVAGGSVLNASSNNALTINGSFPRGVTLVNNGIIAGRGGQGGAGGTARGDLQQAFGGAPGGGGGRGLLVQVPATIFNNGIIAGGGGGGGGGGSTIANQFDQSGSGGKDGGSPSVFLRRQAAAGGGGGGAGRSNNFGSAGGARGERVRGSTASIGNIDILRDAIAGGSSSTHVSAGAGGFRGEERDPGDVHAQGGDGGAGGFWGAAGSSGSGSQFLSPPFSGLTSGGGAGGAGGPAITGNNFITWGATGERYGAIQA